MDVVLDRTRALIESAGWTSQIFLLVAGTLIFAWLARRLVRRLATKAEETRVVFDDALTDALQGPLSLFIWIVGLGLAAEVATREADVSLLEVLIPARDVAVIAVIVWFLIRLIAGYQRRYIARCEADGRTIDRTIVDALSKLLRASVVITGALIALQTLGFSVSGVLAFGGVGGIAVGFAARDLLANMFGGLTIYLDRPFDVGDWIRSPDREIEGTVLEIGWRTTRIRTFDKRMLYVPNSAFTTIALENPSRMTHRRIYETIGVRYDDIHRLPGILGRVREFLQTSEDIDQTQTLMVNVNAFGDSSVDFFIYCFTRTTVWTEYHAAKERVMLNIADIVEDQGGEIAFPTRTLHVPEGVKLLQAEAMHAG